jgi:hypothetical protein
MNKLVIVTSKDEVAFGKAWKGPKGSKSLRLPDFKTIGTGRW